MHRNTTADGLSCWAFEMELDEVTECSILFCRSPSSDADAHPDDTFVDRLSGCYGTSNSTTIPDSIPARARQRDEASSATRECGMHGVHDALREARRRASRSSRCHASRTSHGVLHLHRPKMPATTGLDDPEFEHASKSPNAEFGAQILR